MKLWVVLPGWSSVQPAHLPGAALGGTANCHEESGPKCNGWSTALVPGPEDSCCFESLVALFLPILSKACLWVTSCPLTISSRSSGVSCPDRAAHFRAPGNAVARRSQTQAGAAGSSCRTHRQSRALQGQQQTKPTHFFTLAWRPSARHQAANWKETLGSRVNEASSTRIRCSCSKVVLPGELRKRGRRYVNHPPVTRGL